MQENTVRVVFEAILDRFQRNIRSAARATLEMGEAGEQASRQVNFNESSDSVNLLEKNLNKLTGTLKTLVVGYVGKKLFDVGIDISKNYMEHEQQIRKINTMLIGQSQEVKDRIKQDIKDVSKELKQIPETLTGTTYDALSASVNPENMKAVLETAVKTAVGGMTTNKVSMDAMTSVVNAYGEEIIGYTEVSDQMFEAMKRGKVTIDGFASNLYSVLPPAKALEIPFHNITAALSTMTATGTPIAQATTQIGRMFLEFSREESKASKYLKQATGKTFKNIIAEGHDLQYVLQIMEQIAGHLDIELNNLFNTAEAGNAAFALTGEAAKRFRSDLDGLQNSAGATEAAYEEMAGGLTTLWDGIKSKFALFKISIGEEFSDEIRNSLEGLNDSMDRAADNGSLDSLAQSIGNIVGTIISEFDKWLNNIDNIIDKIDYLASFIDGRLPGAIAVVLGLAKAFLAVKIGMLIKDGIGLFQGAIRILTPSIGTLTTGLWGASAAQTTLNTTMALNPIGLLVIAIGLLVMAIINLSNEYMSFSDFLLVSFELMKIGFYLFLWALVKGFDIIIWGLDKLIGWIPGIGEAFEKVAGISKKALSGLSSAIDESISKIDELNNKDINPLKGPPNLNMPGVKPGPSTPWNPEEGKRKEKDTPLETDIEINLDGLKNLTDKKARTKPKAKKKTINDRIREVLDKHSPDIELYESRSDLAKVSDDNKGIKQNKSLIIETLRKQAGGMLNLQLLSKGQDTKIVEAARNKLLVKIEEILKDINDGVSKMIGDFNTPSDLRVLTEYQYKIDKSDNKLFKRFIYAPDVSMYLTIADTGEKGITQTKAEVEHFTGAIFANDKNDLVTKFMQDVTRN